MKLIQLQKSCAVFALVALLMFSPFEAFGQNNPSQNGDVVGRQNGIDGYTIFNIPAGRIAGWIGHVGIYSKDMNKVIEATDPSKEPDATYAVHALTLEKFKSFARYWGAKHWNNTSANIPSVAFNQSKYRPTYTYSIFWKEGYRYKRWWKYRYVPGRWRCDTIVNWAYDKAANITILDIPTEGIVPYRLYDKLPRSR